MQQHLGNYHQSVPTLSGDALFCVSLPAVRKDFSQLEMQEYGVNFIHINILNCPLFPTSHPFAPFLPLLFSPFDRASACLCFFIVSYFQGMDCSPLSLGSGQEFIFSRSIVSECHLWQEPTGMVHTSKATACWSYFIFPCFNHPSSWIVTMQYKKQRSVHIEINIKLNRSSLMNKKARKNGGG